MRVLGIGQPLGALMRAFCAAAAAAVVAGAAANAADAPSGRAPTRIPAEELGLALRTLAKDRGFQVVYVSAEVEHRTSPGAAGDLTVDEALTRVLRGTGLTFYRMSDSGIVIEPIASPAPPRVAHPLAVAAAQPPPPPTSHRSAQTASAPAQLGPVTVEAAAERRALRRKVDRFVTAAIVQPSGDALDRWNTPICPLVAGLPRAWGELILERISRAALDAHAPLAGRVCHPNLFVVAHNQVAQLVRKWWTQDRTGFDSNDQGVEAVYRFFRSRRPIRAWYNTRWGDSDGDACMSAQSAAALGTGLPQTLDAQTCANGVDTRLTYSSTASNITSAIVVVDTSRMKGMTTRQLADYIALIGLADVRLDAGPGGVPSILGLFGHETPPPSLTRWDRALLYSLYNTSQADRLQIPEMEITMVRRIAP
jgi:hypothetical protein